MMMLWLDGKWVDDGGKWCVGIAVKVGVKLRDDKLEDVGNESLMGFCDFWTCL